MVLSGGSTTVENIVLENTRGKNDKIGQVEGAEGDRSGCFTAVIYLSVSA